MMNWIEDEPADWHDRPDPDEPDFLVTHTCGHTCGYWQRAGAPAPDADHPCSTCRPCPGCGKKAFACECPFIDPFEGV